MSVLSTEYSPPQPPRHRLRIVAHPATERVAASFEILLRYPGKSTLNFESGAGRSPIPFEAWINGYCRNLTVSLEGKIDNPHDILRKSSKRLQV